MPPIPKGCMRFMQSKETYIDVEKSKIKTPADIAKIAAEYLNKPFTEDKYKDKRREVQVIALSGFFHIVYSDSKGNTGVLTEVKEKQVK